MSLQGHSTQVTVFDINGIPLPLKPADETIELYLPRSKAMIPLIQLAEITLTANWDRLELIKVKPDGSEVR